MIKRSDIHIRDPFILTEDDNYYLLGTTGDDPWGKASTLHLYRSSDLEEFESLGCLIDYGVLDGYTNIWAPEIHKYNGKYYLIFSLFREDKGRGSIIFVSDSLAEKFIPLTGEYITPAGWGCLDATLFVYDNKPFLCFSNEWTTAVTGDGDGSLFIAQLSDDLKKLVAPPKKIISGKYSGKAIRVNDGSAEGYIAEGPCLYMQDGKTVLLWSTITDTGYSVIKSVSNSGLSGDFVFEKFVFKDNGGHCMRFIDKNGKARIVLHQPNQTPFERLVILDETDNGD
ncbi:MAG: family 43 glycosylhydrolase [Clostridia bacterium]|nr:family 43 glycosylhydrolase [Clostridia bacterium]